MKCNIIRMSLVQIRLVIVFLLTFLHAVVSSSVYGDIEAVSSNEMIFDHLRKPWIDGVTWLTHSADCEFSQVEKVRTFIRGIESGESWALELMNNFSQAQHEIRKKNIGEIEMGYHCDVRQSTHFVVDGMKNGSVISELEIGYCEGTYCGEEFNRGEIYAIFTIASLCTFMSICTICDFVKRYKKSEDDSTIVSTLANFSLYTNAMKLLITNVSDDTMPAIRGVRFLSCCMVIIGHHYMLLIFILKREINLLDILRWKNSWFTVYLALSFFTVDTFFVISGFLTAYVFFTAKKTGIKFNAMTMYVYRYLRLTPCLGVVLLLVSTIYHRVGSGSLWKSSLHMIIDPCKKNWWVNLLYLQNIVVKDGSCLPQSWYLAVDTQLFLITPIILYILHRRPKIGLALLGSLAVSSVLTSALLLVANGYSNAVLRLDFDQLENMENFVNYYISTFNRSFPYFLGILLGYDVAVNERRLTQVNLIINWVLAAILASFAVWANYKISNTNFAYDLQLETAFAILLRPSWAFAIAWIIYACTQGYGGIATRFLSSPIFAPFSRLSYSLYLVSLLVQVYRMTASRIPTTLSGFEVSYGIFDELIVSFAVALIFSLFVESPVIVLAKILMSGRREQKQSRVIQQQSLKNEKVTVQQ